MDWLEFLVKDPPTLGLQLYKIDGGIEALVEGMCMLRGCDGAAHCFASGLASSEYFSSKYLQYGATLRHVVISELHLNPSIFPYVQVLP